MNRMIGTAIAAIAALAALAALTVAVALVASAGPVLPPIDLGEIATVAPTDGGTSAQRMRAKEKESEDSSTEKRSSLGAAGSNSA